MMNRLTYSILMLVLVGWTSPSLAQEDEGSGIISELEDVAQLFIEKGQYAEALRVYDELREANPDSLDVLEMTIELCEKVPSCSKRLDSLYGESLKIYETLYEASPDDLEILDMHFEICLKISKCNGRLPEMLATLGDFVERNPNSVVGREMLINYALDFKAFETAGQAIEELVNLNPNNVSNWMRLADYRDQTRDFRKLDALVVNLIKRFPKNSQVWFLQADRAIAYSNFARARSALGRADRLIGPKDAALRKRYDLLTKELARSIKASIEFRYVDYRQDTRWSDLEDDFDHSTYP